MTATREYRKSLPADCMLGSDIHPSILERLNRIRELPVIQVATFIGTERIGTRIDLVWQWIDGKTLGDTLTEPVDLQTRINWIRQLEQCLSAIHSQGIVHGSLHANNIIIDAQAQLHITHLSPLLHDDFAVDQAAIRKLCDKLDIPSHTHGPTIDISRPDRLLARHYRIASGITALCSVIIYLLLLWYSRR